MIAPVKKRVLVFAGGGTGGHVYPALALARALPSLEALFVVPDDRGDERRIDDEFETVPLRLPRIDQDRLRFPGRFALAVRDARRVLREREAAGVVGMGGYAAVPVCVAARTLGIPVYLVECNAVAGRATRVLARIARGVGLGSPQAAADVARFAPYRVTGTPLRAEACFGGRPREEGRKPTLLVLGGSQGARGLNRRVIESLPACRDLDFDVVHCAGAGDAVRVREAYEAAGRRATVLDFTADIGDVYSVADLVIARAGASTVAECLARGLPAVFVPYPHHKDRQQERNAMDALRAGAARIVQEAYLSPSVFRRIVTGFLLDDRERERMAEAARAAGRPGAAHAMASHILETLGPEVGEASWMAELGG